MDINFEYYKIFYYVAKYGNITKAAAALGSNQPNVTRVIKLLEAQLNCRLFMREPRGVSLTEEGERLYSHVEAAYRHLICAQEEIGGRDLTGEGIIEIGATETALHLFLLAAMRDFRQAYPRIRIKVHNHTTPEILKYIAAGKLDFAVITTPFETPSSLQCEPLYDFREILVGGTQYRYLGKETVDLCSLAGFPWIGLGRETATYELYRGFFRKHHLDMQLDMEVATSDLLLPLIQHNLGIGFVPETLAAPLLGRKALVQIRISSEPPARSLKLVTDKGRGMSLAAEIFCRYLMGRRETQRVNSCQYKKLGYNKNRE